MTPRGFRGGLTALAAAGGAFLVALVRWRPIARVRWLAPALAGSAVAVLAALPCPGILRAMPPDLDAEALVRAAAEGPDGFPRARAVLDAARGILTLDGGELRRGYDEGLLLAMRRTALDRLRALDSGDPERAKTFLERALALTPGRVEAEALLGETLYDLGDGVRAIRVWGRSAAGWPRLPDAPAAVAAMYGREGNVAQARIALAEALRRDPDYPPARALESALRWRR